MGSRRAGRELAVQILYLQDVSALSPEQAFSLVFREPHPEPTDAFAPRQTRDFARHLAEGVFQLKQKIDELLVQYTQNWDLQRMAAVDRNILRVATFEILTDFDTPISVIINEAIEIAKNYSTEDSGKFVNGILDKIAHERSSTKNKS